MIAAKIYAFIFVMWILILIGGGLMVLFVGPLTFGVYDEIDPLLNSGIKVAIAIFLVAIWIIILTKVKNWIFKKQMER